MQPSFVSNTIIRHFNLDDLHLAQQLLCCITAAHTQCSVLNCGVEFVCWCTWVRPALQVVAVTAAIRQQHI